MSELHQVLMTSPASLYTQLHLKPGLHLFVVVASFDWNFVTSKKNGLHMLIYPDGMDVAPNILIYLCNTNTTVPFMKLFKY